MARLFAISAFACVAACATAPLEMWSPAQEEAVYRERVEHLFTKGTDGFTPQEAVPGAQRSRPLRKARDNTIAAEALSAARAYAAANNSKAFLVWRGDALEEETYFRDADAATPIIAKSLAKPLTAIVIGRAIERGHIRSLDQPVSDFITEWRGGPKAAMLIRHLLDMRTGLLAQGFVTDPASIWNRAYLHPRHDAILVGEYPLVAAPGATFAYSNASSELVAIVIERATGMRYARFVSQHVLAPIGATGGSVWIDRPGGLAHSGCCIALPAQTWMRLALLLLRDGRWADRRLLPQGYVAAMREATPQNPYYGLGVYVAGAYVERRGFNGRDGGGPQVLHSEPYLTRDLYMFDGNANQVAYIAPAEQLVVLRLGDAPPRSPEWDNTVLINTVLRGTPAPAAGRIAQQ